MPCIVSQKAIKAACEAWSGATRASVRPQNHQQTLEWAYDGWTGPTMITSQRKWFHRYHWIARLIERICVSPCVSRRVSQMPTDDWTVVGDSTGATACHLSLLSVACTGSAACSPQVSLNPAASRPTAQHLPTCVSVHLIPDVLIFCSVRVMMWIWVLTIM